MESTAVYFFDKTTFAISFQRHFSRSLWKHSPKSGGFKLEEYIT